MGAYFVTANAEAAYEIKGATLKLGTSLSLDFFAIAEENTSMRFTTPNGSVTTVEGVYDAKKEMYVYTYAGINPQCMADDIDAELLSSEGEVLATYNDYSVIDIYDISNTANANGKWFAGKKANTDMVLYSTKN